MAERGSKGCCHAPFYCSEFYSYCSFLAFLEKRVKMKKVNKINGFCTFFHVFLPFCRTSNPLLSAIFKKQISPWFARTYLFFCVCFQVGTIFCGFSQNRAPLFGGFLRAVFYIQINGKSEKRFENEETIDQKSIRGNDAQRPVWAVPCCKAVYQRFPLYFKVLSGSGRTSAVYGNAWTRSLVYRTAAPVIPCRHPFA